MLSVVAAETAGPILVTAVVYLGLPVGVHLREHVAVIECHHMGNGLFDVSLAAAADFCELLLVETSNTVIIPERRKGAPLMNSTRSDRGSLYPLPHYSGIRFPY